jgi:curli biogenesis system outer membrane secretion channel CsgG
MHSTTRRPFAVTTLAAILALTAPLCAQSIQVEGIGKTEPLAIENALLEAIRQTVGATNEDRTSKKRMELMHANVHWAISASSEENEQKERITTATKGVVESYSVTSRQKEDDQVRVRIEAKVAKFDPSKARQEPFSVVVLPMRSAQGRLRIVRDGKAVDESLDLAPLAQQMRALAKTQLVQSGVFTVLDRDDLALADQELARIKQGDSASKDLARLQQRLVADYLLLGEIVEAEARIDARSMSVPGWSVTGGHQFALRYTVLEVPTGKILRTGEIESSMRSEKPEPRDEARIDVDRLFAELASRTAPILVDGFVGDLDPLMVAKVKEQDGKRTAILTQGGARFAVGDVFEAYELGEELTHPATGASLGREETIVGEIRITDASARLASGEVTTGSDKVARGALVRRKAPAGVRVR